MNIPQLRLELANIHGLLRTRKQLMDLVEARIATTIEGKNEQQRKAALLLALNDDEEYRDDWRECEGLTFRAEQIEAELESWRDARRDYEWSIRLRLVQALEQRAMPASETDQAFDDVMQETTDQAMDLEARSHNDYEDDIHYVDRANEIAAGMDMDEDDPDPYNEDPSRLLVPRGTDEFSDEEFPF